MTLPTVLEEAMKAYAQAQRKFDAASARVQETAIANQRAVTDRDSVAQVAMAARRELERVAESLSLKQPPIWSDDDE